MDVSYKVINITKPLESISYTEENGYYVSPMDVQELIQEYIEKEEFDHIFIAVKLGDVLHTDEVGDWIGLRRYGILWVRIF